MVNPQTYSSAYYTALSVTVTVDLTTHADGPTQISGSTSRLLNRPCRALHLLGGTAIRCTRMDGTQVELLGLTAPDELDIIAKKVLKPSAGVSYLLILW